MYRRLCAALLLAGMFACKGQGIQHITSQMQPLEANLIPFRFSDKGSGIAGVLGSALTDYSTRLLSPDSPDEDPVNSSGSSILTTNVRAGVYYNVTKPNGEVVSQAADPNSAYAALDGALYDILQRYDVPGLSVAITKNGESVFSRSYGYANRESGELVSEQSLFRIASLSKPITSAGILKLIQEGKLMLSTKVFGPDGILGDDYPMPPDDSGIELITIHDLLSHTSGWTNSTGDPMLANMQQTAQQVITAQLLQRELEYVPGSTYSYSNLGYSILGRVIEKVSGKSYADFIQEEILLPANAHGMRLAGDTEQQLAPKEVRYYQKEYNPYSYNMARMDSHGGWLSTTADLMRFMALVDRNEAVPDLIIGNLLETTYFGGETWTHYGSLPGTTAVLTRLNDEYSFVVLANSRYNASPNQIADELNEALKAKILEMESWPETESVPVRIASTK